MEKQCNKCNKVLDYRLFSPNKGAVDGLRNQCKNCRAEMTKSSRKNVRYHPDVSIVEIQCNKCLNLKPVENFYTDIKSKTGYQGKCKPCHNSLKRKK